VQLSEKQRRHLRGLAHALRPVVMIGHSGLTEAVIAEASRALQAHELVKIRVRAAARADRDQLLAALAERTASSLVHRIGHVAVFYRPNPQLRKILIPDN
jgi:RNA-binding protein